MHWHAWNDESVALAKALGKPIFLSIGYASCHWCHVMEAESFENADIAALLNERYVAILVDREEHADVDATYLGWVQAMSGSAGWPMNLVLTPGLQPLFGATYMKREALQKTLAVIAEKWSGSRAELLAQTKQLAAMAQAMNAPEPAGALSEELLANAEREAMATRDVEHGGFGGAPKFPQPLLLEFLLHRRSDPALDALRKLASSALRDPLGGGFHRYAVDEAWREPHFEKMLTDQALLAGDYVTAWQLTKEPRFRGIAQETLDYALRELRLPNGAFGSSQDADTNGVEGAYYTWSASELPKAALPFYDPRTRVLLDLPDGALKTKLAALQAKRAKPARDDKAITGWNGLMISALARAGAVFDRPRYVEAATRAARAIEARAWNGKTLLRTESIDALAEDYAFLIQGLLDLYEASYDVHELELALALQRRFDELFWRERDGRYANGGLLGSDVAALASENELALPLANSVAATNLLRLGELTSNDAWHERAFTIARIYAGRPPQEIPAMLTVVSRALATPKQIVIAGDPRAKETRAMLRAVHETFLPSRVLLVAQPRLATIVPIVAEMKPIGGKATAFVCERFVCKAPATNVSELRKRLR